MILSILEALVWGLSVGILGTTYRRILAYEPGFTKWWQFGARFEKRWFWKPVWGCSHCFAGQITLWTLAAVYVWRFCHGLDLSLPRALAVLFSLIIAISTAILTAKILTWLMEKIIYDRRTVKKMCTGHRRRPCQRF